MDAKPSPVAGSFGIGLAPLKREKTVAVLTDAPGQHQDDRKLGMPATSSISSPLPRASSGSERRHIGTSAPRSAAMAATTPSGIVSPAFARHDAQHRGGISRPAAKTGTDRDVLREADAERGRRAMPSAAARPVDGAADEVAARIGSPASWRANAPSISTPGGPFAG